jgi:large subunit ribosomal protein L23
MKDQADLYRILKKPIITEKSTTLQENNQYVFEVVRDANKIQIRQAVELAFPGRKVAKVSTISKPSLTRRFGKRIGTRQATKKAVVTIVGEPIELFTGA